MKTTLSSSLALAALLAAAPAQQPTTAPQTAQPTTAAEQAFRDAWWAESGQGDLTGALARYLAASTAEGPVTVRAKALLHAGAVQQRLGKTESAIATFRQVLKDHAGEVDLIEQARVHLRELTAVDLTTGYDEWYERRLFGQEVQLRILDRLQQLAKELSELDPPTPEGRDQKQQRQRALRDEIMAFGKGAVPALRKACESGQDQLAEAAVQMLFDLRHVPPVAALRRLRGWTHDSLAWGLLLQSRSNEARSLPPVPTAHERRVLAAMLDASHLTDTVLEVTFADEDGPVDAIARALMQHDAASRQRILEAMSRRQVPLMTRMALQRAVLESEPRPPFTAAEWLTIGEDPLVFDLRLCAMDMAARLLGEQDGGLLDVLLARVATAPVSARSHAVERMAVGLRHNDSPLLVPWTVERLSQFVCLASRSQNNESVSVLNVLRGDDVLRATLAHALLAKPSTTHDAFHPAAEAPQPEVGLSELLQWDGIEERQAELIAVRWHMSLAEALGTAWPKWNDAERRAATAIVGEVTAEGGDPKVLREFFASARKNANPTLHAPIDALLEQLKR